MSYTTQAVSPALDNTFGALLIGVIASTTLYGILTLQTYAYYHAQSDPWILKLLVGAVWLANTAHETVISHTVYHYLVSNYYNPPALLVGTWSIKINTFLNSFITLLVQCYFARRVRRFSRPIDPSCQSITPKTFVVITGVIVILAFVQFVFACLFTARTFGFVYISLLKTIEWIAGVSLISSAVCDLLITVSLCYLLNKTKNGFRHTNTLINTLLMYTMTTGLLTSVLTLATLAAYLALPSTFIQIGVYFVLGRVYSNSLLATLNYRQVASKAWESDGLTFNLSELPKTISGCTKQETGAEIFNTTSTNIIKTDLSV